VRAGGARVVGADAPHLARGRQPQAAAARYRAVEVLP
jgi:hypothetical protein